MKKQSSKKEKSTKPKAEKKTSKKKETRQSEQPKVEEAEVEESKWNVAPTNETAEKIIGTKEIQHDAAPQEPEQEQPQANPNDHLDLQQKERLEFRYGVRITQEDLIGTKDEVAQKIADKTGDAVGEVRKFID